MYPESADDWLKSADDWLTRRHPGGWVHGYIRCPMVDIGGAGRYPPGMRTTLSPSWDLSTDHATSSYNQPVLVNRSTGEAFGQADIVQVYPSHGFVPAAQAVERMAKTASLDDEGDRAMVDLFLGR